LARLVQESPACSLADLDPRSGAKLS